MSSISSHPVEIDIDWRAIGQLFEAGQYDQVAGLLEPSRWAGAGVEQPLVTPALAAVRQISFACRQCHADLEWHRQGVLEAEQREHLLRENAQAILNWLGGEWSAGQDAAPPTPIAQPLRRADLAPPLAGSPWLRNLLHALRRFFAFDRGAATPLAEQPTAAPAEPAEPTPIAPSEETLVLDREPAPLLAAIATSAAPTTEPEPPPPAPTYTLMVYCLGAFRVFQHDQQLDEWNGLKGQAILKYLVAQRGASVARDVLMDLFWADVEAEAARRNLHQAVYSLRQTLRRRDPNMQYIQFENNQYSLNPALQVWVDVEEFERQAQNGRRLETSGQLAEAMRAYAAAISLYQGDFLAEDLYEDWPRPRRQQLRMNFLETANRLSDYYHHQAEHTAAIALCQQMLALDNCFEEAHRRLMEIYLAQGQRHLAIRQYHLCTQALAEELDVPPAAETRALYEQITTSSA